MCVSREVEVAEVMRLSAEFARLQQELDTLSRSPTTPLTPTNASLRPEGTTTDDPLDQFIALHFASFLDG